MKKIFDFPLYNIYFGTIGNKLGVKYRYSKKFKNNEEALKEAKKAATSFFYKNEGKYGIPTYTQIVQESKITGLRIEALYSDHINDFMRFYAIPYDDDTICSYDVKW